MAGGYTVAVLCGLTYGCDDHSLVPVEVLGGYLTPGVQVLDWYAPAGTFPKPPMDLKGAFLLHTAPNVRKLGPGKYEKLCIGTTTSARMVRFTEPLGEQYGVRAICGKGGFPDEAIEPMQRLGMVYFAIVGGAAALETTQIEEIEEVAWEELMPECLWKFRVKDFGPLTVGIDAHGGSLYHDVQAAANEKLKEIFARF